MRGKGLTRKKPMNRGKGFQRPAVSNMKWVSIAEAKKIYPDPTPRKRLRRRRDDAETRAADAAYRATVADLTRICRGRCENPLCHDRHGAEPLDPNHVLKRWRYGRKTQAQRDDRSNLTMLRRGCHEWTDESIAGYRGRLSIIPWGNEKFEFVVVHALPGGDERVERALYTRAKENAS